MAIEYGPVQGLSVDTPPGSKFRISRASVVSGVLLLESRCCVAVGGVVAAMKDEWDTQRRYRYAHTRMHTHTSTRTHTHIHMHTCLHTYTHTHIIFLPLTHPHAPNTHTHLHPLISSSQHTRSKDQLQTHYASKTASQNTHAVSYNTYMTHV